MCYYSKEYHDSFPLLCGLSDNRPSVKKNTLYVTRPFLLCCQLKVERCKKVRK